MRLQHLNEHDSSVRCWSISKKPIFINMPVKIKRESRPNLWREVNKIRQQQLSYCNFSASGWNQCMQHLMLERSLPLPVPSRPHSGWVASRRCHGRRLPRIDEWEGIQPPPSSRNTQPHEATTMQFIQHYDKKTIHSITVRKRSAKMTHYNKYKKHQSLIRIQN